MAHSASAQASSARSNGRWVMEGEMERPHGRESNQSQQHGIKCKETRVHLHTHIHTHTNMRAHATSALCLQIRETKTVAQTWVGTASNRQGSLAGRVEHEV